MIKSLTSLRGIFILFIFLHHCLDLYPGGGSMAVAFFFVLGGFSMTLGYKDKVLQPSFSYKQFLTRRCIKFYPLHWICLLLAVPLALRSFRWIKIPVFFINAGLLQTLIPLKWVYLSYNSVSWYLADTLIFALFFPLLFRYIIKPTAKGRLYVTIVISVLYIVLGVLIPSGWRHYVFYICPFVRLSDFIFGIFLALGYIAIKERNYSFWNRGVLCHIIIFSLIAFLVLESCLLSDNARLFAPIYWLPVALIILIASLLNSNWGGHVLLENKLLCRLGELSFIIFLAHKLIISYSSILFEIVFNIDNKIIFVLFTFTLTILVSVVLERFLLNPITQWLTKRIQPSMTVRS